ncbi:MAG: hypothetical protein Kow00108_06480 [Calditrichia bacterium]
MRYLLLIVLLVFLGSCSKEKEQEHKPAKANPHAEMTQSDFSLLYDAPEQWIKEQPTSKMRKDQYRLPGKEGQQDAEMTVFFFPHSGGSIESNLKRWYGQFISTDDTPISEKARKEIKTINGLEVTIVEFEGTYKKAKGPMMMGGEFEEMPGYALLAAIVPTDAGPWFFKCVGPEKTIRFHKNNFEQFIQTFKLKE